MPKNLFILTLVLFSSGLSARDPSVIVDLSDAKPIIIERQKELLAEIKSIQAKPVKELHEAYGKLAMFYYVHDYVEASIKYYNKALALSPHSAKWHYLIGIAYKNQGEFEKVIEHFEKSIELNPQYMPVTVYLGEVYIQQGQFEEAKKKFLQVLNKDQNYVRAVVGYGQVLMLEGKIEAAIKNYKKALNLQTEANQIHFLLSSAYASLGDMEQSQKHAELKGQNQAQMYDPIVNSLYEESRSYTYYNDKAVQAFKAGNVPVSEKFAKTAIKYDEQSPYPKITLANIYAATGRVGKAIEIMLSAQSGNEGLATIPYMLGALEEMQGDYEKAVSWFQQTIQKDPYHKQAHEKLSNNMMRLGEYDKAAKQLKTHLEFDADNSESVFKLAVIHAFQQKCDLASQEIYQAVKLDPRSLETLLTFVKIAVHCDVSQQMLSDALNAARNIYRHSQEGHVVETLAMIEAKNGNHQEAIDYQAQVIFQHLSGGAKKESDEIVRLKKHLELYKQKSFPKLVFTKASAELNPPLTNN